MDREQRRDTQTTNHFRPCVVAWYWRDGEYTRFRCGRPCCVAHWWLEAEDVGSCPACYLRIPNEEVTPDRIPPKYRDLADL